ncbi:MAG: hypothetical protein CMM93_07390 [Rickettsiales bacterium]|nr:hypothetical protein [Rickettsiales bacterium]
MTEIGSSNVLTVLIMTFVASLAAFLIMHKLHRVERKSLGMRILKRCIRPATVLIFFGGLLIATQIYDAEHEQQYEAITDGLAHACQLALIASLFWLIIGAADGLRHHLLRRYDMTVADNLVARKMHTQVNVFYRLISVFLIIIAAATMLLTFDGMENIGTSLLASAGLTGIVIGFAAQKTLGSIFAGIQIAITQPIRLEDAVVVEGEWGWIEEITLTYVVIRIWDLRRLVVPITYFVEKPFQNWTRSSAEIIGSVELYLDYDVPLDALRAEFERLLDETPLWNKRVQVLQVTDTTEKTQKIRLLMTAKDSPTTWDLRCYIREHLIIWLQQHYPQSLPRFRVDTSSCNLHTVSAESVLDSED